MPTYTTTEEFACGHTREIINRPCSTGHEGRKSQSPEAWDIDTDTRKINETIPIPTRCLACTCHCVLEASYGAPHAVPRCYLRELNEHVRILSLSATEVMRRELRVLGEQVRCLDDVDEFQKGVIALAGYLEISTCFGL